VPSADDGEAGMTAREVLEFAHDSMSAFKHADEPFDDADPPAWHGDLIMPNGERAMITIEKAT
jgi:hypothetical protein